MENQDNIGIFIFDTEIGKLKYDYNQRKCYFQYNPLFLDSRKYQNIFPFIFKRVEQVQVFTNFDGETFHGLPPMIADVLPDSFGNIIFQKWLANKTNLTSKITPLQQLAYLANRGMGAIEFKPSIEIPTINFINIDEIIRILNQVLDLKNNTFQENLSDLGLLNIFKIGTSAGGARPKIIVSEHKKTGKLIPGDLEISDDYNHYLVKLSLNESVNYNKEKVEFAYYKLAKSLNINMMDSKLIDNKHFATLRFDRINGEKIHILTACGLTGWDFMKPENSSYENLFKLAVNLKIPYKEIQELFKRMVFNLVFANIDDHLKNHSFIYNKKNDSWHLSPAYDLTYPLNALQNYLKISRALSINEKRENIEYIDIELIANKFSIKNPKKIILEVQNAIDSWDEITTNLEIPKNVSEAISKEFKIFV